MSMHFLMESAMAASKNYKILPMDDVEAMRQELDSTYDKVDAARHKLALETKARDAARSMGRVSGRDAGGTDNDIGAEGARKCDELGLEVKRLEERQQLLQTSLLEHTAGVLQATHKGYLKNEPEVREVDTNGALDDFADASHYRPYTNFLETGFGFGGDAPNGDVKQHDQMILDVERKVEDLNGRLRGMILEFKPNKKDLPHPFRELQDDPKNPGDVLLGQIDFLEQCLDSLGHLQQNRILHVTAADQAITQKHEEHNEVVVAMESRVEDLNAQVRSMILDMKPAKEDLPNPARELRDDPNNPRDILDEQMDFLENCLELMQKLRQKDRSLQSEDDATEERLETLNTKLFQMMTTHNPEKASKYTPPPEALGESLADQLEYLAGGLGAVDRRLKELNDEADGTSEQLAQYQERAEKYATTVGGLWDTLSAPDPNRPGTPSPTENFSLQAFATLVQNMHRKHSMLEDQKAVLTRQIQQQRELNATADTAKDSKLTEVRDQLERTKAELEDKHREVGSHSDKLNATAAELDALRKALALREEQDQRGEAKALGELKAAADAREIALGTRADELEGEVVRLRTELTVVQAELDSAHGTRAERAAEAGGEAAELRARQAPLQQALADPIGDYAALTRASHEVAKARADGLRDRVEKLEAQLAEERIQALGAKSPTGSDKAGAVAGTTGGTGAAVLKTEFRKMMRETRMEHSRALRVGTSFLPASRGWQDCRANSSPIGRARGATAA